MNLLELFYPFIRSLCVPNQFTVKENWTNEIKELSLLFEVDWKEIESFVHYVIGAERSLRFHLYNLDRVTNKLA